MIKNIRKVLFFILILFSFLFCNNIVYANTINKIDIDVYIDSYGKASVTEIWDYDANKDTEIYKTYEDIDDIVISNFKVSDDSGIIYEYLPNWNINADFSSKAYKNGLHYISNGVELCWGISNYGHRTYTISYDISNFVKQYTDTQGIYFPFLNTEQNIRGVKINIHSDVPFSLENSRIWGFGNNGTTTFENNNIVLDSNGTLYSGQYMTVLVRFESNIFNIQKKSKKSFDDIYDEAFSDVSDIENSNGNINNSSNNDSTIENHSILAPLLIMVFFLTYNPLTWIIVIIILGKVKGNDWLWGSGKNSGDLDFGTSGKVLPSIEQIEYFREIPCKKDLEMAYWVCSQYNVVTNRTLKEGIIGAILLKWIKNNYITVTETKKGLFSFKDNNYAIDFTKMTIADNEIENNLFKMLIAASGSNRILEAKEFSKWSKKNYDKINSWFASILLKEQFYLEQQGLITNAQEEVAGMFGSKRTITTKVVNPILKEEAIKLKGLKKFLLDFSIMPEREYFEVHIWEEYLIFAELLGIADTVEEQFSKLYPQFKEQTRLNTEFTTIAVRSMAEICYRGVQAGIAAHQSSSSSSGGRDYSGSSSSSGGGGSSYSSGGSSAGSSRTGSR